MLLGSLLTKIGNVLPAETVIEEDSGECHNDNHEHGSDARHGSISWSYRIVRGEE